MNPGPRKYKQASLEICEALFIPEPMRENVRELHNLQSGSPREGHATALLYQICAEADMAEKSLMLLIDNPDAVQAERLQKFYTGFGFLIAQPEPCLMLRTPQKPLISMSSNLTMALLERAGAVTH